MGEQKNEGSPKDQNPIYGYKLPLHPEVQKSEEPETSSQFNMAANMCAISPTLTSP